MKPKCLWIIFLSCILNFDFLDRILGYGSPTVDVTNYSSAPTTEKHNKLEGTQAHTGAKDEGENSGDENAQEREDAEDDRTVLPRHRKIERGSGKMTVQRILAARMVRMKMQRNTGVQQLTPFYESPEGTWGFSKKAISKSLYRIVQSVLTD